MDSGPSAHGDDEYAVRAIPGERASKVYRCPGCDQTIAIGIAHVVVWPLDAGGVDERRHWHRGCWSGRRTRGVTRKWS